LYQALYRKWRPKIFDDVVGQDHVTKTLKSEVMSGRISHAYLFTGSRGTGKTSCAKILAKAVNCLHSVNGNPCLECEICKGIGSEIILDIVEIDAASNNGVENIRAMREEVVFSPTKCKYRVYIVDEVHMLSTGAFNAFLKMLEEPPAHVIFILATTEVHKLPATIISRCQRFDFYKIAHENIFKRIKFICEEEKIKIDDGAAKIISESADGAMRDALSILDQCANACQNNITEESVKKILGITGTDYISKMTSLVIKNCPAKCLSLVDKMYRESKNMLRLCEEMMESFRRLMICKVTDDFTPFNLEGINPGTVSLNDILTALDTLQESYKNMNGGANKKLEAEIAVVKLCGNFESNKETDKTSTHRLSDTPQKKPRVTSPEKSSKPEEEEKETLAPSIGQEPLLHSNSGETLECWAQILEALKNDKSLKSLYISLMGSSAYVQGNYILINSSNSLAFELLRRSEYRGAVKKIVKEITGKQYSLGPYSAETEKQNLPAPQADPFDTLAEAAGKNKIEVKLH
jgi:DNA polymerase-3 subunit gamma/tau